MNSLGVFAKYWQPGQVKTRLAATHGPDAAAQAYHHMLSTTLHRLHGLADRQTIVFWPESHRGDFSRWARQWNLQTQVQGGLTEKLIDFFAQQFNRGAKKVIAVGSDCPHLPTAAVTAAWQALDQVPLVLGPAEDGGYFLIGLNQQLPFLFDPIDWSTDAVLSQTCQRASEHGVAWQLLPPDYDLDDQESVERFVREFQYSNDPALAQLADQLSSAP